MRKVALVFVMAVFVPSFVLAWLAVRSQRDQQFIMERQQAASCQGLAGALVRQINGVILEKRREFNQQVDELISTGNARETAGSFDNLLKERWPLAEVGFVVSLQGSGPVLSPSLFGSPEARTFRLENDRFLCSMEAVEVYWNSRTKAGLPDDLKNAPPKPADASDPASVPDSKKGAADASKSIFASKSGKVAGGPVVKEPSKISAEETEFRNLIGDSSEGTLARFLQNRLKLLIWYRPPKDSQLVFGAQLHLGRLVQEFHNLFQLDPNLNREVAVALLDDAGRPVAASTTKFRGNWKKPFVSTQIGEALPHWTVAVYFLDPAKLSQSANAVRLTIGALIALLLTAIGIGSYLIATDLRRQIVLSQQKTDFVSNVSHELKTPLTSIRMFSELLAEGRVAEPGRQREYLGIISTETARLSRLINNVLDFARLERGEKKYHFAKIDLVELVHEIVENYRTQLESTGFTLASQLPAVPVEITGDRDALAQVLLNLLSNAEKYSGTRKEIEVRLTTSDGDAQVSVLDRGIGVPESCAEKIFEQFYRAHDSLSSGIQGSGLGLTLARQISRGHGGHIVYNPRESGGSCFTLILPLAGANAPIRRHS
jgi:signal transduction histidine kinase